MWTRTTWGAVSDLKYGKALRGYSADGGTVEVFGTNGPIGWTGESLANGPRPVVGRKGAYRGVHLAHGPFWVIDTAYWLEPSGDLDPVWAYYNLLTVDINGMDSGSAIPSLTKSHFVSMPLCLPPLDEQRRIAEVLGALDDLIDTNERLADRLWSSAEAVFERTQNIATTQMALGEVIELRYGKALPADSRRPGSVPVVSSAGISGAHDTALVEGPGVVVGRKGSVGSVTWVDADFFPIDTAFYVHRDRVPMSWAFFLLQSLPLDTMNTDSAVPGLNRANALALRVLVPDSDTLHDFDVVASELIGGARVLRAENEQLRRTRDELLPLLMSGAVRVRPEGVAA